MKGAVLYIIECSPLTASERELVEGALGLPLNPRFFAYERVRNNERNTLRNTRLALVIRWSDPEAEFIIDFIRIMRGPNSPWCLVMILPNGIPLLAEVTPIPCEELPPKTYEVSWTDDTAGEAIFAGLTPGKLPISVRIGAQYFTQQISPG